MTTQLRACVLILVVAASPWPAAAQSADSAVAQFERGVAAFEQEDYDRAAAAFAAAYEIAPKHEYLYAWAQAERMRGNCERAVTLYRMFLAVDPPAQHEALARTALQRCLEDADRDAAAGERDAESLAAPPPAIDADGPPRAAAKIASPALRTRRRSVLAPAAEAGAERGDGWTKALLLAGAVGVGGGLALYISARADAAQAAVARSYDQHGLLAERSNNKQTAAFVGGAVGVSLLVAGSISFVSGRDRGDAVSASAIVGDGQIGFAVMGAF